MSDFNKKYKLSEDEPTGAEWWMEYGNRLHLFPFPWNWRGAHRDVFPDGLGQGQH